MKFEIIPTPPFQKEFKRLTKKYPSLKKEINDLALLLTCNPFYGTPLGSGCYKIRLSISSKGKGRSGGGRMITFVQVKEEAVFLLSLYDKSEIANISEEELKQRLRPFQENKPKK